MGQEWVGGFEGEGLYSRRLWPQLLENFFPYLFLCVGQSVNGWVPLELEPPLAPMGEGQVLWVLDKSGCLPFLSYPPHITPFAEKSHYVGPQQDGTGYAATSDFVPTLGTPKMARVM